MRKLSWLERKGVCFGLLWGILSVAEWPELNAWTKCLQAPFAVFDCLWLTYNLPARAQLPYILAIVFSGCVVYVVAHVVYLWGRCFLTRSRRGTASRIKRRSSRRY